MQGILRAEIGETKPRRSARGLSRRRVRGLVGVGQRWIELDGGRCWTVRQVHRKDGLAALERGDGAEFRYVHFGTLGKHYRPVERSA